MSARREPGSPEWYAHLRALIAQEGGYPLTWWYLSFASGEAGFLGACVVQARGPVTAMMLTHSLKINPGGEVMTFPLPDGPGPHPPNRLLSKADLGEVFTVGELEDRGVLPGPQVQFHD